MIVILFVYYNISNDELQEWIDYKYNRNCKRLEQENVNTTFNIQEFEKCASYLNRCIKNGITIKNPKYDDLKDLFK